MIDTVKKRDGSLEPFNEEKIAKVIEKALNEAHKTCLPTEVDAVLETVLESLNCLETPEYPIENIQDLVQEALMKQGYFDAAAKFIEYRLTHKNERVYAQKKIDFIENFKKSDNTANATIDDNSNVSNHNIAVLNSEIHKTDNQITNLRILENKLKLLYPEFDYKQMRKDFDTIMYLHDSSSQIGMPYCVAISLYPFLLEGLKDMGGLSAAPKNIDSFCGMFVNLVFAVAGQFKGAVATPGLLLCMDYFLRKEWGDNYYEKSDVVISNEHCLRKNTIEHQIHQYFQQICYTLMQPSGSRGSQACFWNVSIFDKPFFDTMYEHFRFPDGEPAKWESLNWLQKNFLHWLNQERLKCVLTFPVVSVCLINQNGEFLDKELADFTAQEYSEGNSFFTYISDSADSLSSCCRLSSKIEKPQFNFTNGQLSEMTGSKNVITLNLNRIIQDFYKDLIPPVDVKELYADPKEYNLYEDFEEHRYDEFKEYLTTILERVYKYQTAYNECLKDLQKSHLLSVYDAGFIAMKKQYLTIGINGLNQAAEFLGISCTKNEDYKNLCNLIFSTIKEQNLAHKTSELMFNTEFTPCESAAVKLYNRDAKDGYWVPKDTNLYASYIFKPNDTTISILDKLYLHGNDFCGDNLDGGSACHVNLEEHPTKKQCEKILNYAASVGCKYFTFNIPNSECDDCGFITKVPISKCPKCGSERITLYDRVIGYLTAIKHWSKGRQIEQKARVYDKVSKYL